MILYDDLINKELSREDKLLDSHIHLDNLALKLSELLIAELDPDLDLNFEQQQLLNKLVLKIYRLFLEHGFAMNINRLFNMNLLNKCIIPTASNFIETIESLVDTSTVFVEREIISDDSRHITNFYGVHPITISRGYKAITSQEAAFIKDNSNLINDYAEDRFKGTSVFNLGEIGLDVNYKEFTLKEQIPLFKSQIHAYLSYIFDLNQQKDVTLNLSCHNVGCALEVVTSLLDVLEDLSFAQLPVTKDFRLNINCILHAYNEQKDVTNKIIYLISENALSERFKANYGIDLNLCLYFGLSNHFAKGRLDQSYREVLKSELFKQGKLGFCFETDWPYMNQPEFRALTSKLISLFKDYLDQNSLNLDSLVTESESSLFCSKIKDKLISKEISFSFEHPLIKQYERLLLLFQRYHA